MRQYLLLAGLLSFFSYCNTDKKGGAKTIMVDPDSIHPSEIVHDSLSSAQIDKIKQIHLTFAEVYPVSLEETITDFKRDAHPDNEIAIWSGMAEAYLKYLRYRTPNMPLHIKKEVFSLILSRSMMSSAEAIKNTELKYLTTRDAEEVLAYYTNEADPIDVIKK